MKYKNCKQGQKIGQFCGYMGIKYSAQRQILEKMVRCDTSIFIDMKYGGIKILEKMRMKMSTWKS